MKRSFYRDFPIDTFQNVLLLFSSSLSFVSSVLSFLLSSFSLSVKLFRTRLSPLQIATVSSAFSSHVFLFSFSSFFFFFIFFLFLLRSSLLLLSSLHSLLPSSSLTYKQWSSPLLLLPLLPLLLPLLLPFALGLQR
ncbi:hypothetical protein CSUI_004947 [Cystoisospora suis]|uniref:Transmembrane protein n=1 Tax=Cystoisospora suis TaxID=483139 RepID=A0A2C6KZP5_9APIC|nr:hypothetical protein CSUI_004947 [Cystoisospora suis]